MKKIDRSVEISDLVAVGHVGEDLVIFIDGEEENISTSLCVLANFDKHQFGPVQPMADYLEINPYQPIQDGDTQLSYQQRILEEMNQVVIESMLNEFTQKYLYRPGYLYYNYKGWAPGG